MGKLDLKKILAQFDNDMELFKQLVEQFHQEMPQYLKEITTACEKKNWKEVHRLAHKIHGASANFLDNPVRQISKQMEILTQRSQTGGIAELSKHLELQTTELLQELSALSSQKAAS